VDVSYGHLPSACTFLELPKVNASVFNKLAALKVRSPLQATVFTCRLQLAAGSSSRRCEDSTRCQHVLRTLPTLSINALRCATPCKQGAASRLELSHMPDSSAVFVHSRKAQHHSHRGPG
jgi:hypothetical protein